MANDQFNLLEWYASHRGEAAVLRDPALLFALGLLDHVGPTSRGELQKDLGVDAAQLDQTVEKLYDAGLLSTQGTTLAITPRGQQFLTEVDLRGPLPPPSSQERPPDEPEPPRPLPATPPPPKQPARAAEGTPLWLYGLIGLLVIGAIVLFGSRGIFDGTTDSTPTSTRIAAAPTTVTPKPEPKDTLTVISNRTVTPRPAPDVTSTESLAEPRVAFDAKPTAVRPGGCAVLSWQVVNSRAVTLDGERVQLASSRRVCPKVTTDYTLSVLAYSGNTETHTRQVQVLNQSLDYVWVINSKNVPLNDSRVEQAFAYTVDDKTVAGSVLGAQGSFTNSVPQLDAIPYSPNRALALLKQAGYDGQAVTIAYEDDVSLKLAEYIAKYLAGINVPAQVTDKPDSRTTILVSPKP